MYPDLDISDLDRPGYPYHAQQAGQPQVINIIAICTSVCIPVVEISALLQVENILAL
jgi:hypothetical protein